MPYVTAAHEAIEKLYHYERFNPEYFADLLGMKRIHFSNPEKFNDPLDSSACIDITQADNPDYRAAVVDIFRQWQLPMPDERRKYYEHLLKSSRDYFVDEIAATFRELVLTSTVEHWRTYCLTKRSDVGLMWSHYADHHRGICLEFDARQSSFQIAAKVEYMERPPSINLLDRSSWFDTALKTLTTKSWDWCYEEEFRILARNIPDMTGSPIPIVADDFLAFEPHALTGIIMGSRADEEAITKIISQHAELASTLVVKKVTQLPHRYMLSIQEWRETPKASGAHS